MGLACWGTNARTNADIARHGNQGHSPRCRQGRRASAVLCSWVGAHVQAPRRSGILLAMVHNHLHRGVQVQLWKQLEAAENLLSI